MLNASNKQKIDSIRNVLVGKVPDPKSQIEQITIALFYKFMWDRDNEVEELGGNPKFFIGDFKKNRSIVMKVFQNKHILIKTIVYF